MTEPWFVHLTCLCCHGIFQMPVSEYRPELGLEGVCRPCERQQAAHQQWMASLPRVQWCWTCGAEEPVIEGPKVKEMVASCPHCPPGGAGVVEGIDPPMRGFPA
jgi:hypothetical protein